MTSQIKNYNFLQFLLKINFFTFFYLISFYKNTYSYSGTLVSQYNFGYYQNPEIDKSYNHLLGRNIYFITDGDDKTMYTCVIYPYLTLEVTMKMYTSSKSIINAFNNGEKIYFGFDLLIDNTDSTLRGYSTDIIICIFDKKSIDCYDYVSDDSAKKYLRNDGGKISNNNLVPLGFDNIELNILQENVMDYDNYFCIKFEKKYPELFDNITMFNWINYVAADTGDGVYGFYGIVPNGDDMTTIDKTSCLYIEKRLFDDGDGLPDSKGNYISVNKSKIIFITIMGLLLLLI